MITSIQVKREVKQKLDELKNYPTETYNEILLRMLEIMAESREELSSQTLNNIQKSLEDIKAGRVSSHKQVKQRLT
jgi:predicted transcriptional regulator